MITDITSHNPDCEIISTRIVEASQELVFAAWTEPDHLKNWWGPAGFTNTFHEFDLRPGGSWRFTMHGPDKGNYENECVFIKIEKPSLVAWQRISKPIFRVTAFFEEQPGNKTKIVFTMIFDTPEECNKLKAFAPGKNEENFDRLENELSKMSASEHSR